MGLFRRNKMPRTAARSTLRIGDAAYDDWPIVGDYETIDVAMAFCQQLREPDSPPKSPATGRSISSAGAISRCERTPTRTSSRRAT